MINSYVEEHSVPHEFSDAITQLLMYLHQYMRPAEIERVKSALQMAIDTCRGIHGARPIPPLEHALAVSNILAQMHIDAIGVSAGLVFEAVDAEFLPLARVEQGLGSATARVVDSMARLNILERK